MDEANIFKWIDFYTAFATKLLEYKDDRQALIGKIRKTFEKIGISLPTLDKNNHITDIDPFTVFGLFNKGITDQNRIAIIQGLISEFSVNAVVPDDFFGIPVLNPMKATFYRFEDERQEQDIDNLWAVFEAAIDFSAEENEENRKRFCAAYDQALSQYAVKWNLTMGLYWIRPNAYLNLDSRNRLFLNKPENTSSDIAAEIKPTMPVPSAEKYLEIRDKCRDVFSSGTYDYKSFPELSYKAWKVSTQPPVPPEAEEPKTKNEFDGDGNIVMNSQIQYTWIDFYTKFATKMLEYKGDRQALIEKIQRTYKNNNMSLPKLESAGMPVDIDPFTVFSLLNKRSDEDRKKIIQGLISEFSVDADVPEDFSGAAYNQHLMQPFYTITGNRKDDDIDNLWSMFEIAILFAENDSMENRESFCKSYDQVQKQWNVARSLTAGLYWIRPYAYINLDYRIHDVLKNPENLGPDVASKITSSVPSGKKYLDLIDSCLIAFSSGNYPYKSFPELSYKAWTMSTQNVDHDEDLTGWEPAIDEYTPNFTVEQWEDLLTDKEIIGPIWGGALAKFYTEPRGASCKLLGQKFNENPQSILARINQLVQHIHEKTRCPLYQGKYWPILFIGRKPKSGEIGSYIWKLRPELFKAMSRTNILKYLNNTE